jgi:hypothetical protein
MQEGSVKNDNRYCQKTQEGSVKKRKDNNTSNNITSIKQEFRDFSEIHKSQPKNISSYLLYVFLGLGYIPAKDETIETFQKWVKESIIDFYKITHESEII